MPSGPDQLLRGSAARRQIIDAIQVGTNADEAYTTNVLFGGEVKAKGRIVAVKGGNMNTAIIGDSTHDIVPYVVRPSRATPLVQGFVRPVIAATDMRLVSTDVAGVVRQITPSETDVKGVAQVSLVSNFVGPAAWAYADGWFVDGEIECLSGDNVSLKRQCTKYLLASDTGLVDEDWPNVIAAGDLIQVKSRRLEVEAGDWIVFGVDFTIGTGTAGEDAYMAVVIENYDRIDLF